jgi:hypothetical protein
MVNVEVPQESGYRVIGTHGIDISIDGIVVAADAEFDPTEAVTLAIPLANGLMGRVPGRVLCQTENLCRFTFEFASDEQHAQLAELISGFTKAR